MVKSSKRPNWRMRVAAGIITLTSVVAIGVAQPAHAVTPAVAHWGVCIVKMKTWPYWAFAVPCIKP